ncbi:hypothetical protein LX87_01999 [Larkinella arboricola]|uniref:Uncharacterized protein n=1 Tax=Larkinella arboricola TaxID=643671 RepID=A0A327X9F2_LARAB|nr:hypothetical protein LX87_01999 [Larkinella arboricola]
MWLHFAIISLTGESITRYFYSEQFESHMDVLNEVVRSGSKLIYAFIRDEADSRINLPVEAFDGTPVGLTMRELHKDIQRILNS